MDKYVSANKLKAKVISGELVLFSEPTQREIFFLLELEPSEDVEPVTHAHWIRRFLVQTGCYECSNCGRYSTSGTNYCGSCGAKMDGMDEVYGREKLNQIQNLIFNQKLN